MKKIIPVLTFSCVLAACASKQATPPIETFSFSPNTQTASISHTQTVRMMSASITPQFSNYSFIYRTSTAQYITDPYRQFLAAPNIEITTYLENKLASSLNANLISSDNLALANYVLQENITELYADYRDKSTPEAVITIQFILYQCNGDNKSLMGTTTLTEKTTIAPNNPTSLIAGYQSDLDNISQQLSDFINQKIKAHIH